MSHALTGACELLCQCSLSIYRTFQCNILELNSFGWSRFIWEIPGYLMCAIHTLLQIYCHQLPDQLRCAFNSLCCDCSTDILLCPTAGAALPSSAGLQQSEEHGQVCRFTSKEQLDGSQRKLCNSQESQFLVVLPLFRHQGLSGQHLWVSRRHWNKRSVQLHSGSFGCRT